MYVCLSGVSSRATRACETPRGVPSSPTPSCSQVLRATVSLEPREVRGNIVILSSKRCVEENKRCIFFEVSPSALFYFAAFYLLFYLSQGIKCEKEFYKQQNGCRVPAIALRASFFSFRKKHVARYHSKDTIQCKDAGRISVESAN